MISKEDLYTERAARVAVWVTGGVMLLAWAILPAALFWVLLVIVAAAVLVGFAARFVYWRDQATMLYGDLVFTQAARDHYKSKNEKLQDDNTQLVVAFANQNLSLTELIREHSKCSPPVATEHTVLRAVPKASNLRAIPAPREPRADS